MENLPLESQPDSGKPRRFLPVVGVIVAVLIVGAIGVYSWLALYGPCGRDTVETASIALLDQMTAFETAYQSAASTTPIGLIGPISTMEQTIWDTREVSVPGCMQAARNELITSMESAIRAYLAMMAGEEDQTIRTLLKDSRSHLEHFATDMDAVDRCAPLCLADSKLP